MAASVTKHAYAADIDAGGGGGGDDDDDTHAPSGSTHRNFVNGNGKTMRTKTSNAPNNAFDWSRNEATKQQRKLRLTQVRGQSKEIASQVRKKVEAEKQRQLDVVNAIKRNEMLQWRQQQIAQTEGDYKTCLYEVGAAHVAAQRETEKMEQIEAQRIKNRKLALRRGRMAAEKVKAKRTNGAARVKQTQVHTIATQVDDSLDTDSVSDASDTDHSDSGCSAIMMDDNKATKKMQRKATANRMHSNYDADNFVSVNGSTTTDASLSIESPPVTKFTRVSDLLKKKAATTERVPKTETITTKPYISKTYKLDTSGVEPRRSPPKKHTITKTVPLRPGKSGPTHPATLTVQPIKRKAPIPKRPPAVRYDIKPYVPRFIKPKQATSNDIPATRAADASAKTAPKVQFYDHSNRFAKEYDSKLDVVESLDAKRPPNAMQEAELEREREHERQKNYLLDMAKARQMEDVREEEAREKTRIRKDYDLMSSQLASLLKDEELTKRILHSNDVLSEKRLREIEKERQALMNADFERMLNKPSVVITCPKRSNTRATESESFDGLNVAKRQMAPPPPTERVASVDHSDYSSGSCNSFLLEYVTSRTTNLTNDIDRIRTDRAGDGQSNRKKADALTALLTKVNGLRKILSAEIDRNATNGKSNIDFVLREMDRVNERQAAIMKNDENKENVNGEQLIAERERMLKLKETQLEQKVKELYLREKRLKSQQQQQLVTVNTNSAPATATATGANINTVDDIPVRIVINVNKEGTDHVPKEQKWGDIIGTKNVAAGQNGHTKTPVVNRSGKVYRKTPAKVATKPVDISSPSTTLTAYLSPPEAVQTELSKTLHQSAAMNQATNTTAPLPNAQNLNPQLLHYIVRLLGMTRTSIEQLNVSSVSTMSTPSSSIVNVSQNRKMSFSSISSTSWPDAMPAIDDAKWEQLNRFIAENYKFISNLNETINKSATGAQSAPREATSEPVWNELLQNEKSANIKQPKSIMRKQAPKATATATDKEPTTKNDLIVKYDELTANCTKRINDLDQMISKVREEKLKLLENTLSSAGSLVTGTTKENTTEYMDLPHAQRTSKVTLVDSGDATITLQTSSKSADSTTGTTSAPSPEFSSSSGAAIAAIINKTGLSTHIRQFGESKDSGVGGSRPVTSSDFRESPELRPKGSDHFVPLLDDIPKSKINYRINDIIQSELQLEQGKRVKLPPAALSRFSPNEEQAHELSTITEVDTPATSRLNATTDHNAIDHSAIDAALELQLQNRNAIKQMLYTHFPDFKEYAQSTPNLEHVPDPNADATNNTTTAATTSFVNDQLNRVLQLSEQHTNELKYRTFATVGTTSSPTMAPAVAAPNATPLIYQQFPSHSEYAKDTPGLLDSQSINQYQSIDSVHNETDQLKGRASDDSSLPDIVEELRKRNILLAPTNESTSDIGDNLSDSLQQELQGLGINWASSMMKKSKQALSTTATTTTSSSSSTSIHDMAATTQRSHAKQQRSPQKSMDASSTMITTAKAKNDKVLSSISQLDGDTTTTTTAAQPVNLKEFMVRALMKHSSSSSSSSLSGNDSSIASIFLKSCLGNSTSTSNETSTHLQMPRPNTNDIQRTSTPVAGETSSGHRSLNSYKKSSTSPQPPPPLDYRKYSPAIDDINASHDLTGKLFSGESNLSSVRINQTDGSSSDVGATSSNRNTVLQMDRDEFDALVTPFNVQLNAIGMAPSTATTSSTTTTTTAKPSSAT